VTAVSRRYNSGVLKHQDHGSLWRSRPVQPGSLVDRFVEDAIEVDVDAVSDGKDVVMHPEALRKQTQEAAARASPKLTTRLSKGEKSNRKRMAEVGCVYDAAPVPRTPTDILVRGQRRSAKVAPKARNKWGSPAQSVGE